MDTKKAWAAGLAVGAGAVLAARLGAEVLARRKEEDLTGKVALITGGSSGLGFLLARDFARAGCRVAICARKEDDLAEATDRLRADGADVAWFPCDVSDPLDV